VSNTLSLSGKMTRTDFNDLVHQLSRKMYGYAFRILRSQEEAEDAVQEVFIKLWKMGEKLGEYTSIEALTTTMTKNYCIDQIRKRKYNFQQEFLNQENKYATTLSPLEELEGRESNEIIHTIIDRLPEGYRLVIQLREIDDLSYEEIAEKTGQNINALRVALSRARKLTRDEFNKYQYERKRIEQLTRKVL
jgi:RNA polymerase sigma factor (sigma-70 family)